MKNKTLLFLIFFLFSLGIVFWKKSNLLPSSPLPPFSQSSSNKSFKTNQTSPTLQPQQNKIIEKKDLPTSHSVFLPYWSLPDNLEKIKNPVFDDQLPITNYHYFGIAPNENGIAKNEPGYLNLDKIKKLSESLKVSSLVLRMTNNDLNLKILEDEDLTKKLIDETIQITKNNNFEELILDLEVSALPFENITNSITNFVGRISDKTREENIKLSMTIYADIFYRKRPYDLKILTQKINRLYVMGYDFHKLLGTPGPNFPLNGKEKYGYDLNQAMKDFIDVCPKEKLIFIFGLYGYDWTVDDQNRPIKSAKAFTLKQISKKFLKDPQVKISSIKRDPLSSENEIHYQDDENQRHIVWFEDKESVLKKQEFLKSKGINQFSYWAWGYY